MNVLLIFTYGISLKIWDETGLLNREIGLYKKLNDTKEIKFTFLTFGNEVDHQYDDLLGDIKIFPIYSEFKFHKNKIIRFLYTFVICFKLKKQFKEDHGWVISAVYDAVKKTTFLVILNAEDLNSGPICTIDIKRQLPYGFHGSWKMSKEQEESKKKMHHRSNFSSKL